jgi:hypothetical protein
MRIVLTLLVALAAVPTAAAREHSHAAGAALTFSEHSFAIDPPTGHDGGQNQQVVTMALPPINGFAPNVSVQVQPFKGTLAQYDALTLSKFKQSGVAILAQKRDAKAIAYEYRGLYQGQTMHWYLRAFATAHGIVLSTATATDAQWSLVGNALRQSVDSARPLP